MLEHDGKLNFKFRRNPKNLAKFMFKYSNKLEFVFKLLDTLSRRLRQFVHNDFFSHFRNKIHV